MKVKNKLDSIKIIKDLNLNRFEEEIFNNDDDNKILDFIDRYPYDFYAVRSKSIVGCKKNNFKTPRELVLSTCRQFDLFSINVSSYNFTDNLVLIGDTRISKNNDVWLIASKNKNYTGRMAELDPDYNFKTDIFDKRLNGVPEFDLIFKYIVDNSLLDVIVEFAIYDKPVGINKEKVIIFEIRTDF